MGNGGPLTLAVKQSAQRTIVALRGELDLESAPRLEAALAESAVRDANVLVLDLTDVSFIDSTGLRAILAADERARTNDRRFAVTRGSDQVQKIFAVTGTDAHLEILDAP